MAKLYVWQNSKQRTLTRSEVKSYIMKTNKWTSAQYRKQYDILKNKIRAYESYRKAQGINEPQQSVVEFLFKEAKAKRAYGNEYVPSKKAQQIKSFSAYSITKGRKMAENEAYLQKQNLKNAEYIGERFGDKNSGFIKDNKGAQEIVNAFEEKARQTGEPINYAKLEEALADYADAVHAKVNEQDEVEDNEAIPSGETYGSDTQIDFDIDNYLL